MSVIYSIEFDFAADCKMDVVTLDYGDVFLLEEEVTGDLDDVEEGKPKRNIIFNKFLPYADRLHDEAHAKLAQIKANLGKAVACRELKPGCYYWSTALSMYIFNYGRDFSKEDHIAFIKLLYELVTIPDLEFFLVDDFARVLTLLLKKKELLSRKDLVLPWRPLAKVYDRVVHNKWSKQNLIHIPSSTAVIVPALIRACRVYFPIESTQEMLEEWKPLMCPYTRKEMSRAMAYFELFLPTILLPEEHENGFKLWFTEFIQIWETCHTTPPWEGSIVYLFSRLADSNIGYIDWTPFIPMIATRLLRSFHLPVFMKQVRFHCVKEHYNLNAVASLLVAMLGNGSSCQTHLSQLFKSLESFYHPSNSGIWNFRLQQFIAKLTDAFIRRLKCERRPVKTWETPIPASHKLTEDDITAFVQCIKPCVMLAMFSKNGCYDAAMALKNLAILRPELTVPTVLERFYPATETLIEPHRLLAVVQCLAFVIQPMVRGGKYLPEGPTHVLPILMSCLPGIDPNDTNKTLATFQLISCLVILVPLVDCSQMMHDYKDLTELERDLCSASAQFEDFVLQFMDRCFVLIESSSLETALTSDHVKEGVSSEEKRLQTFMSRVFNIILNQCSPEICEAAVRKLNDFVTGRILGIKDAGYLAAKMVQATTYRIDAEFSVKLMLSTICNVIEENCVDTTTAHAGQELLFNMLLLQELVCCDGRLLLPYRETLLRVLKKLIALNDKEGRVITSQTIKNLLTSLTSVYILEQKSIDPSNEQNELPIRNWGRTTEISKLKVSWHTGNEQELQFAQELVDTFLTGEMTKLTDVMEGNISLTREQLQQSIATLHAVLLGCLSRCPLWDDAFMPLKETCTDGVLESYYIHVKDAGVITLNGENLRSKVAYWLRQLTDYLLKNHEDNIVAFRYVIKIYHHLMFFWGHHPDAYQKDWKYASIIRKILDNPLKEKKHQFRYLLIQRIDLQHKVRVSYYGSNHFSKLHQIIMCDLLNLATNHYMEIRCTAQWVLGECYLHLPFAYLKILPQLEDLVNNAGSYSHEKLKGMLYILLGEQHMYCLLARRDWEVLLRLWPVVVKTPISDQPTVNMLLETLVNRVNKQFETFAIIEEIPQSAVNAALELWATKTEPACSYPAPSQEEIEARRLHLQKSNEKNMENYLRLVKQQVALLETPNLHWQSFLFGIELLNLLIRHDVTFPIEAVLLMMQNIVHDSPLVRFWTTHGVGRILQQHKPVCAYVEVMPKDIAGADNDCLYYDCSRLPSTAEEWDKTLFVDKPHIGYYQWPKMLQIHASPSEQAFRFKKRDKMNEIEKLILDFFTVKSNVENLMKYMSAENNKDQDKLEIYKCNLYRNLFRNYGNVLLPHFSSHIETLLRGSLDSEKRCGLEIVTGLVAGSKHWNYSMLTELWEFLAPVMKTALSKITIELQSDWCRGIMYMVTNADPRRMKWLLELLVENLLVCNDGSFVEANRLFLLFTSLNECVWRVPSLLKRILDVMEPHLAHPYQNIRDELGRLLGLIFLTNADARPFPNGHRGPSQKDFVVSLLPKLEVFEQVMHSSASALNCEMNGVSGISDDDPEWKTSVALLKTICRWLRRRLQKTLQLVSPDVIQLLPILCQGETCDRDPELQNSCRLAIAVMSHAYLPPEMVPVAIQSAVILSNSSSWRARKTALEFLQVLVFSNLFTILQLKNCVDEVTQMVLKLLEDSRPEVQQMAVVALSGMLHSNILTVDKVLLDQFVTLSKTPIQKQNLNTAVARDALRRRHAGILGMSAIVRAHPYDICDGMPEILVTLGSHLQDPQPVQTTVRQALTNFWRTHHDNWHDHKLKFTDDQLADIMDLLVSPNYYA